MRAWSELSVAFCQKQKEDSSSFRGEKKLQQVIFLIVFIHRKNNTVSTKQDRAKNNWTEKRYQQTHTQKQRS